MTKHSNNERESFETMGERVYNAIILQTSHVQGPRQLLVGEWVATTEGASEHEKGPLAKLAGAQKR